MVQFIREIYPVGQGGFAFEQIGDFSLVFDCGSKTSPKRVTQYIQNNIQPRTQTVNRLFISHFDRDHVNSIKELNSSLSVEKAVIPYIPTKYRGLVNLVTDGAYQEIRELFSVNQALIELEGENKVDRLDIWEWIAMPMLNKSDWNKLDNELIASAIDSSKLSDVDYLSQKKETINKCFAALGQGAPNSKGLILLSQKIRGVVGSNELVYNGRNLTVHDEETAALYLGDAHAKGDDSKTIQAFLKSHFRRPILLAQIPHHGSQYSSGSLFDSDIPARYYYYQDTSSKRLKQNSTLFTSLQVSKKLLDVTDVDSELIHHSVDIL